MTLSETKAQVRRSRGLLRGWRHAYNERCRGTGFKHRPTGLNLCPADFGDLEWGLTHLCKEWVYDLDADGERIPGTGRLIRIRGGYTRNDGTQNFMFKGIPVRCAEPVGFI